MQLDFWFDPGCGWSWAASRWLLDATARRDVTVAWRSFSLWAAHLDPADRPAAGWPLHQALRVVEATRAEAGEQAVERLYTELGRRVHHLGDRGLSGMTDVVRTTGLDLALLAAADDAGWDAAIAASMREARERSGGANSTPLLGVGGAHNQAFVGPLLSPAPIGEGAAALLDAVLAAMTAGGFVELSRARPPGPQLPPQPAPASRRR